MLRLIPYCSKWHAGDEAGEWRNGKTIMIQSLNDDDLDGVAKQVTVGNLYPFFLSFIKEYVLDFT